MSGPLTRLRLRLRRLRTGPSNFPHELSNEYDRLLARLAPQIDEMRAGTLSMEEARENVPGEFGDESDARSTPHDVLACYRLLLGRRPDAAGFMQWIDSPLTPTQMAREFIASREYREHQERIAAERHRISVFEAERFRIWVRDDDWLIGQTILRQGTWEPHVTALLGQLLRPGDTFVDVGANYGWHTLGASVSVGPEGRVVAYEPFGDNCRLLLASVADNGFTNVELRAVALDDEVGVLIHDGGTASSNGTTIKPNVSAEQLATRTIVPATTLDIDLATAERVDVLKLDIEGGEATALDGAREVLARHRPHVLFEIIPDELITRGGSTAEQLLARMLDDGYRLAHIGHEAEPPVLTDSVEQVMAAHAQQGTGNSEIWCCPPERTVKLAEEPSPS